MSIAIVDARMPEEMKIALKNGGFSVLSMPPYPRLSSPVASHPDMLMLIRNSTLYTYREYRDIAKGELDAIEKSGIKIECTDTLPDAEYPRDVALNCFFIGDTAVGRRDSAAECVRNAAERFIDVRQGYAACSTVLLDGRHVITEDRTIADAMTAIGVEVCKIPRGGVSLIPYDCGFIGGASGVYGDTVFFTGNLSLHPSCAEIEKFISDANMRAVSLSDAPLYDFGKILFV